LTSLKAKIYAGASANAGLQALLGTSPFRWFDQRLEQGTTFPAVVVKVVSNGRSYVGSGLMPTGWSRVQFDVYGSGDDSENAELVVNAISDFLESFDAIGIPGQVAYPSNIVADRDAGVASTQPMTYLRIVDVMMFSNADAD
jgi:hypothetical protein